jgi:ribonuclease-3
MNKRDKEGTPINYERLEFVGDAMVGSIIATHLFNEVPQGDEGYLTKMRSKIVSREHLNELGKELNLIDLLESKIPKSNFGNNIHGNLFEALVGAIFLDRGYAYCEKFIYSRVIIPHVDIIKLEGKVISYKSLLIEWCQKEKKTFDYHVYEDTGNDTLRHFSVKLSIDGKVIAKARATSKKKAEEKASKRAFFAFQSEISKAF